MKPIEQRLPEHSPQKAKEVLDRRTLIITTDGSTTAGKRLVAEHLADRYDLSVLNTGTTFRALALLAIEQNLVKTDETNVTTIPVDFIDQMVKLYDTMPGRLTIAEPRKDERIARVRVGKRDMRGEILAFRKQKAIDNLSSVLAASPEIRSRLMALWREAAEDLGGVVVIGRRTGIDLFPDAPIKLYLFASPEASAVYRVVHDPTATLHQSSEELYVRERDGKDREIGLLERAPDAIVLDTSEYITKDGPGFAALDQRIAAIIDSKFEIK